MFLKALNNQSNKAYKNYYEVLLGVLASIMVFREIATIGIILFVLFHILFYKEMKFDKTKRNLILLIAIPFILNVLFFWNNDSLLEGLKQGEKYLACLIFPICIIGQRFKISITRIFKIYGLLFTIILLIAFVIHFFGEIIQFRKYFEGVEVWKMGYQFALSMNLHAPALNMHVSFLVIVNLCLLVNAYLRKEKRSIIILRFVVWLISIVLLLLVNTKMAIFLTVIGIGLISTRLLINNKDKKSLLRTAIFLVGCFIVISLIFVSIFPYTIEKYSKIPFKHLDKIGRLDEIENPEAEVYSALVTRLSVWRTTIDLVKDNILIGVGASDGKSTLIEAYRSTDQKFLYKHKFAVHNQYLDFLLKFGILGFIGVVLYIFNILRLSIRSKEVYIYYFFILFLFCNLTDDFLIRFDGITFSALWISVFSNTVFSKKKYKPDLIL